MGVRCTESLQIDNPFFNFFLNKRYIACTWNKADLLIKKMELTKTYVLTMATILFTMVLFGDSGSIN